jgi:hypothetical protein
LAAPAGAAETAAPVDRPGKILVELVDGSRIVGSPHESTVGLLSILGAVDIPLGYLRRLAIGADRETAVANLDKGDHVTGVLTSHTLTLTAAWGTVHLGMEQVSVLTTLGGTNALPMVIRPGLLLWNRLDSERELALGPVGAGGTAEGGQFVKGRLGGGIEMDMKKGNHLTFWAELGGEPAGCVEFWFKVTGGPVGSGGGAVPLLRMEAENGEDVCELALIPDDGDMYGGLWARGRLGRIATAYKHSYNCDCVAQACTDGNWHHLALVWDGAGNTPGVSDASRKITIFLDGQSNINVGGSPVGESLLFRRKGLVRLTFPGSNPVAALPSLGLDNLRVWRVARTDFSDRYEE